MRAARKFLPSSISSNNSTLSAVSRGMTYCVPSKSNAMSSPLASALAAWSAGFLAVLGTAMMFSWQAAGRPTPSAPASRGCWVWRGLDDRVDHRRAIGDVGEVAHNLDSELVDGHLVRLVDDVATVTNGAVGEHVPGLDGTLVLVDNPHPRVGGHAARDRGD